MKKKESRVNIKKVSRSRAKTALKILLKTNIKQPTSLDRVALDLVNCYFYKMTPNNSIDHSIFYCRIGDNCNVAAQRGTLQSLGKMFKDLATDDPEFNLTMIKSIDIDNLSIDSTLKSIVSGKIELLEVIANRLQKYSHAELAHIILENTKE